MNHPAQADEAKGMTRRLTADEHAVLRAAVFDSAEIVHHGVTDQQVRDQDELFGVMPEPPALHPDGGTPR
jgi:hypothetical protein